MKKVTAMLAWLTFSVLISSYLVMAQAPPAGGQQAPPQPMSFFVTSTGSGNGANLGGLAGADALCQKLATAAGSTKTFHAYLSTQGPNAVNARDRIGPGPWYNARGARIAMSLADLHGDTIEQARLGNNLTKQSALVETGAMPKGAGDTPNQHDVMTGSLPDGRAYTDGLDHTCGNYTSNADVAPLARGTAR